MMWVLALHGHGELAAFMPYPAGLWDGVVSEVWSQVFHRLIWPVVEDCSGHSGGQAPEQGAWSCLGHTAVPQSDRDLEEHAIVMHLSICLGFEQPYGLNACQHSAAKRVGE
jgi:hypothetical protein